MRTMHRLRIGVSLTILSGIFLAAGVLGAVAFWRSTDPLGQVLTILICLAFAVAVGSSVSIIVDYRVRDVPWGRIGILALAMLAGCGLALLRRAIGW